VCLILVVILVQNVVETFHGQVRTCFPSSAYALLFWYQNVVETFHGQVRTCFSSSAYTLVSRNFDVLILENGMEHCVP
jgi:hypothetical protein